MGRKAAKRWMIRGVAWCVVCGAGVAFGMSDPATMWGVQPAVGSGHGSAPSASSPSSTPATAGGNVDREPNRPAASTATRNVGTKRAEHPSGAVDAAKKAGGAPRLAFRVGKVVTMDDADRVINNAVVLVSAGRIEAVGPSREIAIPDGYEIVDRPDLWLVPGMVDAHNHTAGSLADLNDMVYLTNPGLRTLDTVEPESERLKWARAGGVTTVLLIPGSGTNISGFGTVSKTAGEDVDAMVRRSPGSLKIAQAGNPERYWWGVRRMMMNYNTRQTLSKARAYHQAWTRYENGTTQAKPAFDPVWEGFRGLFRHEYPVSLHTQIYQVLMTSVDMIANKFQLRAVLDHCTFDAWKVAPLILESPHEIYTINGPRQYHLDRTQKKMHGNAARWWQGGIRKLGINTDAPVVPQEELPYQAAMACWYGWKPYEALRGVTRIPAEALMVADQIGSIEVGKEAELALWTGDPIDPRSSCEMTIVGGHVVYDATSGRRW